MDHDAKLARPPVRALAGRALTRCATRVPPGLELDLFEGQAWVGIVPFHMTNVAPRGVPALPWVSAFPELNVRTYVRVGSKPGVYFFSLDAANPVAVGVARTMFNLPYYSATMEVDDGRRGAFGIPAAGPRPTACGRSSPPDIARQGRSTPRQPGSLDYFLTERYCLYTVNDAFELRRLEIHHPPWPLQAAEATIDVNTMADAAGIRLPSMAPLLHFAKRQDMVAWAPALRRDAGSADAAPASESRSQAELERARLADGGDVAERRRRIGRIRACAEVGVPRQHVLVIGDVEGFDERFEFHAAPHLEHTADTGVHAEEAGCLCPHCVR